MSSVRGFLVLVALATILSPSSAGFGNWWSDWSEEVPTNCPHQNSETHVCSTLQLSEGICRRTDCCEVVHSNRDDSTKDTDDSTKDTDDSTKETDDSTKDTDDSTKDTDDSTKDTDDSTIDTDDSAEDKDDSTEDTGESSEHSGHHGGNHGGHHGGNNGESCSLCAFIRSCTLYKCRSSCCDGYERDYLGRCTNETGDLQCENGGVLKRWWGNTYCACPRGFRGHNCEKPICRCKNDGECVVMDGKPHCNCSHGYYGDRCEKSNCTKKCYNGGKCYINDDREFCWCPDNYIGRRCKKYYTNPETCPVPEHVSDMCEYECTGNSDCEENHVCCKEGCSAVCRKTKAEFCTYEGSRYDINSTCSPDPCTDCFCTDTGHMTCSSIRCSWPECSYGEPSVLPGNCCPSCPDKPDPPKMYNCPTSVLYLNTTPDSDQAYLDGDNTKIQAYDSRGKSLLVKYRPEKVHHCHCSPSVRSQTRIQAYATDEYVSIATCSFNVIVKDVYPPRFTYCPSNIEVSESTAVRWRQPAYQDNVGIARISVPERESDDAFPAGRHVLSYMIWDHDGNKADCNFTVTVTKEPPRIVNCPTEVLYLNTKYYTSYAVMNELSTGIHAYDFENNELQVHYEPQTVDHCKCPDSMKTEYAVKAMVTDDYGKNVTCTFKVIIKDVYLPKYTYCPGDIEVSEGASATWNEPTYTDNVGIGQIKSDNRNGDVFPVGKTTITYGVWDWDSNKASCLFHVYVEESVPPKIHNCPNHVLVLNTPDMADYVELNESTTSMSARDADGGKLKVNFRPRSVRHCYCNSSVSNETLVEASTQDQYGNVVTCQFKVVVLDQIKPVITYCPENMRVSENDVITWRTPEYYDNVQVMRRSLTGRSPGSTFPVGSHRVAYEFWDYGGNSARCQFNVTVTKAKCTLECYNGGVCHRYGNDQFCRCPPNYVGKQCGQKYIHTHCQHEGNRYLINETYSQDPCSTCTCTDTGEMICTTIDCAIPKCAGGRQPVSKPDRCCLECPEDTKPRITCPSHIVHVNTSHDSDDAMLDNTTTFVEAYDSYKQKLKVQYRPPIVYHCKCNNPLGHETTVHAYAKDTNGNMATCSFKVVVRDIHPPKVSSCPEDIHVFEKEIVSWLPPSSTDNVGVAGISCSSQINGTTFPVGEHRLSCDVWDFERNRASCQFHVSVISKDSSVEDMPLGHRERYKKDRLKLILPPVFGAIIIAVIVALLLLCCRRKHKSDLFTKKSSKPAKPENIYAEPRDTGSKVSLSKRPSMSTYSSQSSKSAPSRALAFHSNLYVVPGDVCVRPPPYTSHSYRPPPYSLSGSIRDVTYMSLPLPSYQNPEYETLGIHSSSVYSPSVRSGSSSVSGGSKAGSTRSSRPSSARSTKSSRPSSAGSVKSSKSSKSSYRA